MAASGCTGRHGHRDKTLILIAYRYGLRVSELVALRWESIDLQTGLIHNNRLKNGVPPTHPLHGVEIRALRRVRRRRVNLENIDEEDVISIGVLLPVEGSDSEKDGERSAKFYHLPTTDVHIPPYVTVFEQMQNGSPAGLRVWDDGQFNLYHRWQNTRRQNSVNLRIQLYWFWSDSEQTVTEFGEEINYDRIAGEDVHNNIARRRKDKFRIHFHLLSDPNISLKAFAYVRHNNDRELVGQDIHCVEGAGF